MFSYNFNRAINNKVNWDQFESNKIVKIAPGFGSVQR